MPTGSKQFDEQSVESSCSNSIAGVAHNENLLAAQEHRLYSHHSYPVSPAPLLE